jgi:hypothetical protein
MVKERKERDIEPKYVLVISMLPEEAEARHEASAQTEGVTFEDLTVEEAEARGYMVESVPSGKVVGITKAESDAVLEEFNTLLHEIWNPNRH